MVKVTCKFCSGTRTIPDNAAKWQCRFCMRKNYHYIPEPVEEIIEEEPIEYDTYDSQEIE